MSTEDIKELELWQRELDNARFETNGSGSHARHTDEAFTADLRYRLLGKVIGSLKKADMEQTKIHLKVSTAEEMAELLDSVADGDCDEGIVQVRAAMASSLCAAWKEACK